MTVLFVIGTILFFLILEWFVRWMRGEERSHTVTSVQRLHYPVRVPEGIFFSRSHTWINLLPSGKLRLGIDDFLARLIENPEIKFLKHEGDEVRRGEPLFGLVSGNHVLSIQCPIDGRILEVNNILANRPEALREQLFSDGWGYLIQPKRMTQLRDFFIGTETRAWIREEFHRLGDFFAGVGRTEGVDPAFMQDGGLPMPGILKKMDDATWKEFEREFLQMQ